MKYKVQNKTNKDEADQLFEQAGDLIAQRNLTTAEECLKRALTIKQSPEIFHRLGAVYFMTQNLPGAVEAFQNAVALDPNFHKSYASLAEILRLNNQIAEAISCWAQAIKSDPKNVDYLNAFLFLAERVSVNSFTPQLKELMLNCLNVDGARIVGLSNFWLSLLKTDDVFGEIYALLDAKTYEDFKAGLKQEKLSEPLFILGLAQMTAEDIGFEKFLTYLRRAILEGEVENLDVIVTLSQYCFATEYIFQTTDEEEKDIKGIVAQEKWFKDPMLVAIVSCYKLLSNFDVAPQILQIHQLNPTLKILLKLQVSDCLERLEIQKNIEPIVDIKDGVSKDVQQQYEIFPYPSWMSYTKSYDQEPLVDRLRGKKTNMLIAGCGTGREAVSIASAFPEAHVLAVDLSKASLSYGIQKAGEFGIENISFRHGDILSLGELDQEFDYIASSGVLHHMEAPKAGWHVLTQLLKKDGLMRIALYSRQARRHIIKAREVIADKSYAYDQAGISQFRCEASDILSAETLENLLSFRDYYHLSECRDLLFHVQEHQFDLPEIGTILEDLDLAFIKMAPTPETFAAYRATYPDDREGQDLKLWHAFEQNTPDAFRAMYQFWCQKKSL